MNMNVSLTDELGEFVKTRVSSGRYTSASEVVREALRMMEHHEQTQAAKLEALRRDYQVGLDSGNAGEIDFAGIKAEVRAAASKAAR